MLNSLMESGVEQIAGTQGVLIEHKKAKEICYSSDVQMLKN